MTYYPSMSGKKIGRPKKLLPRQRKIIEMRARSAELIAIRNDIVTRHGIKNESLLSILKAALIDHADKYGLPVFVSGNKDYVVAYKDFTKIIILNWHGDITYLCNRN